MLTKSEVFPLKAMKNALPVGANLKARGINPTASCPHCGEDESCLHLFFHCSLAQQVWNQAPFKCSLEPSRISSLKLGIEASNHLTCLPPTGIGHGLLFPWIMWTIWTCRNKKIFDQKSISSQEIITQTTVAAKEWIGAQLCHQSPQILSSINPIPEIGAGTIRCFTDAAWRKDSREAGFGWIFIDPWSPSESPYSSAARHINSPLLAEATALLLASQQAADLGFSKLSFASDSQQLVKALNGEPHPKELHGILHDILSLSLRFVEISFHFVKRENNHKVDALAKAALISSFPVPVCN